MAVVHGCMQPFDELHHLSEDKFALLPPLLHAQFVAANQFVAFHHKVKEIGAAVLHHQKVMLVVFEKVDKANEGWRRLEFHEAFHHLCFGHDIFFDGKLFLVFGDGDSFSVQVLRCGLHHILRHLAVLAVFVVDLVFVAILEVVQFDGSICLTLQRLGNELEFLIAVLVQCVVLRIAFLLRARSERGRDLSVDIDIHQREALLLLFAARVRFAFADVALLRFVDLVQFKVLHFVADNGSIWETAIFILFVAVLFRHRAGAFTRRRS
mmetsp:Transcript_14299/g.22341  ORF Transcript_14299/g.22341 Transcript_14299/m.22341 type:complete len:266 (+) Transcript_14299:559-1356(+)